MLVFSKNSFCSKYIYLVLAFIIAAIAFIANSNIMGPTIQADELSYLANAAAIAGYHNDFANSYHAGYSLLLAPSFWIADTPASIWSVVKVINALLVFLTVVLMWWASCLFQPKINTWRRFTAVFLTAIYPMWIVLAGYSFAQIAFVPLYLLLFIFYIRSLSGSMLDWVVTGSLAGCLYWIHPLGLAAIAALLIGTGYISWQRRSPKYLFVLLITSSIIVFLYEYSFTPWLFERMTTSGLEPNLHYPSISNITSSLTTVEGIFDIITRTGGYLLYLTIGTVGLFWVGFFKLGSPALQNLKQLRDNNLTNETAVFIFLLFSVLFSLFMGVFASTTVEGPPKLDHWMYGRFFEGVISPFLLVGTASLSYRKALWALPIGLLCMGIMLWGLDSFKYISYFNMPSLWQALAFPNQEVWIWILLGLVPILMLSLMPRNTGVWLIAAIFIFSSYQQIVWHYWLSFNHTEKWEVALHVREYYPEGSCVGFDRYYLDDYDKQTYWYDFSFILYDYNLQRMSLDDWLESCDGPLISYNKSVVEPGGKVNLAAISPYFMNAGPLLLSKKEEDKIVFNKMEWYDVYYTSVETFSLLGDGWHGLEDRRVWSTQQATIEVYSSWFTKNMLPKELVIKINVYGASEDRQVDVYFDTGDGQIVRTYNSPDVEELVIPLDGGEDRAKVKIEVPKAISPLKLSESADTRVLGISLYSFQFR